MLGRFAFALVLVFVTESARASENYPAIIRGIVPTNQDLPCTLCHASEDGGDATIATAFAREMLEFGMRGGDPASLERALLRNGARRWDSDGDGVPDIEELVYGSDPSSRALSSSPPLMHGCSVASKLPAWHVGLAFTAAAWLTWKARRRSRASVSFRIRLRAAERGDR